MCELRYNLLCPNFPEPQRFILIGSFARWSPGMAAGYFATDELCKASAKVEKMASGEMKVDLGCLRCQFQGREPKRIGVVEYEKGQTGSNIEDSE